MSAVPCFHRSSLAAHERRVDTDYALADARESYIDDTLPYLANKLLSSPKWLEAAGGHAPVIAAQERTALCFTDPCEYGLQVRRAVIELALTQAEEHLDWIARDTHPFTPTRWPHWRDIDPASVV